MNTIAATGWLQKDAWTATVPGTYARILCFDLFLVNHRRPAAPAPTSVCIAPSEAALTVAGASKPIEVTDLEVRYDYQNDLEKIWNRVPVR